MNSKTGKILRIVAVVLMGLTAAINLLGGAGTTCAAFFTKKYPPMWALIDYQWLYQTLVVLTVPLGLVMIWATILLVQGKSNAMKITLWFMSVGMTPGLIVSGLDAACPVKLNGKRLPEEWMELSTHGAMRSTVTGHNMCLAVANHYQWVAGPPVPVHMVLLIWPVTFGNGLPTGTANHIMWVCVLKTHKGQTLARCEYSVVAHGG